MRNNKLRELIKSGKPTIGTRIFSTWPGIAEIIGQTGMIDYIEFVGEYAPWDLYALENLARAIELFDMSSMIKVDQSPSTFIAQRALGAGIQNILFTDIRTYEDAKNCIKIVKPETPDFNGINGCHCRRNVGYIIEPGSKEYVASMNDTVIAIMIEKRGAVENLENILSIEGIDMVQFGACDYSMSTGHVGDRNHKEIKEAELKTIKTAIKMGIRPRIEIGKIDYKLEEIEYFIELGVRDFNLPFDISLLFQWLKKNGKIFRDILYKKYNT